MDSQSSGFEHGTTIGYNHGCRCQECRDAMSASRKATMARALEELKSNPEDHRHGTRYVYDCGCRCDACREEASARRREAYRARMRSLGKPPRKSKKWAKPMRTDAGHLILYDSDGNVLGAVRGDGAAAVIMGRYYEVPMS